MKKPTLLIATVALALGACGTAFAFGTDGGPAYGGKRGNEANHMGQNNWPDKKDDPSANDSKGAADKTAVPEVIDKKDTIAPDNVDKESASEKKQELED